MAVFQIQNFLKALIIFPCACETNEVTHVTSLARTMKSLNKSMHGDDLEMKVIPEDQELSSQYLFFYEMSLPMGLDLPLQAKIEALLG